MKISYSKTVYGKKEIRAVVNCLKKSTQMGANTQKFEKKISIPYLSKISNQTSLLSEALFMIFFHSWFEKNNSL